MKNTYRHLIWCMACFVAVMVVLPGCTWQAAESETPANRMAWDDMDFSARRAHMQTVVVPLASEIFRAWRPARFNDVDCSLCHGPEYMAEIFHMPTAHLPGLSGKLLLGPELQNHPDTTRLKLDRLVPQMAAALDKKPFSIITRRGFGCYSCHLGPSGPAFGN